MPPRKTFFERLKEDVRKKSVRDLMLIGMAAGLGLLLHLLAGDLSTWFLVKSPQLYALYCSSKLFRLLFEMCYSCFVVAGPFALVLLFYRKTGLYREPLPFSLHYDGSHPMLLIFAGLGLCYAGDILSSYFLQFCQSVGIGFSSYDALLEMQTDNPKSVPMLILTVLHTAVVPALAEEFVFRGVIMQPLRKYGDWFAIVTSAVLFGLVHGNFVQIPFAIIAGVALGYVCTVTGSLWMSMALHLLNNLLSVLYSMLLSTAKGAEQLIISSLFLYGMILLGVVSFLLYCRKKRSPFYLYGSRCDDFKGRAKFYFLMPSVAAAIILLLRTAILDMKRL